MNLTSSTSQNRGVPVKAVLLMAPCLVCLYVNGVMLFALSSKSAFLESSRYLLFGHLLLSDSLHLVACMLLYMIAVAKVRLTSSLCMFVLMLAEAIAVASPLTLAVMSLERYVAICLPLRHAQISTQRRTGTTIAVLWCVAMVDPYVEVLYYMALGNRIVTLQTFCSRNMLAGRVSTQINTALTGLYFLLVGAAITYTYVFILLAARSATATSRASKARRTVLLHMLQLCLCLTSTMYNMMNSTASMNASRQMGYQIQYLLFLCFIIFPRFLNPLIYGLRDNAFRAVFIHYFLFSDISKVVEVLFGEAPPPILMIGHSMGGAIAVHAAAANQTHPCSAFVSLMWWKAQRWTPYAEFPASLENAIEWRVSVAACLSGGWISPGPRGSGLVGLEVCQPSSSPDPPPPQLQVWTRCPRRRSRQDPSPMNLTSSTSQNRGVPVKAVLLMAPCLVCLYVNGVMLFALSSKSAFLESSRYLLFGHLLLSDSLHLVACVLLYMIAVAKVRLTSSLCMFVLMLAEAIAVASPLTLAVMSLERYVAICLPLRHAQISTQRRTGATIAVLWCVAMVDPYVQVLYYMVLGNRIVTLQTFCSRNMLAGRVSTQLNTAFTGLYFLLVGAAITYTYVFILLAARSATATSRASKARRTVLLHMLQLCLCLTSTMYNMMNSTASMNASRQMGYQIQYLLFLCFIIFPRFLNPLIYGLRDNAFRAVFKHYFLFRLQARGKQLA
ncbi:Odorant receptor 131-2 [Merluccius polli]|uniref:Odorant receptor 131-2 n=1 Tax=Merluccius polli TaxID=89951 RepID=A0AA47MQL0_MERPO|nr:Odorant receptor 131-2 [Merluccius polli]